MIRLMQVELTRLRWRRAVLSLTAAAVLIPAVVFAAVVLEHAAGLGRGTAAGRAAGRGGQPAAVRPARARAMHQAPRSVGASTARDDVEQACADLVLPQARVVRRAGTTRPAHGVAGGVGCGADRRARHPDAAGGHHLRRPRLELRVDEQPAALRPSSIAGVDEQGAGRARLRVGRLGAGAHGVLDRHVRRRVGARHRPGARARSPPSTHRCSGALSWPAARRSVATR